MMTKFFQGTFFRYVVVGVLSVVTEMLLLILFVEYFDIQYLIGNVFSFTITSILNYGLSRTWVFEPSGERKRVEFTMFMIFVVCGLLINQLVLWYCVDQWTLDYRLSKLVAAVFVIIWNFFTRKHLVFNRLETVKNRFSRK